MEKRTVLVSAGATQTVAPSRLREAMATMGPVLASAFCVAAIMYPLGLSDHHARTLISLMHFKDDLINLLVPLHRSY